MKHRLFTNILPSFILGVTSKLLKDTERTNSPWLRREQRVLWEEFQFSQREWETVLSGRDVDGEARGKRCSVTPHEMPITRSAFDIRFYYFVFFNPLNPELNPICYLLALLGAYHFLHVSRIRVKLLTFRLLMAYIYGAPILDVSRSHTTTQHSR